MNLIIKTEVVKDMTLKIALINFLLFPVFIGFIIGKNIKKWCSK